MDWMSDLQRRFQESDHFQISIDAQIWTVEQQADGSITFTNEFGRQEQFRSPEKLSDALQSWYENPTIIVR